MPFPVLSGCSCSRLAWGADLVGTPRASDSGFTALPLGLGGGTPGTGERHFSAEESSGPRVSSSVVLWHGGPPQMCGFSLLPILAPLFCALDRPVRPSCASVCTQVACVPPRLQAPNSGPVDLALSPCQVCLGAEVPTTRLQWGVNKAW